MLEAALEASRDAILVVDLDRQILRYNQRYLEMFGFTAAELAGGGVDHIIATIAAELDEPDGALAMSEAIWAVPSAERLDVMRFKDGRVIERFVAPLVLGAGIVGRTASFRNISAAIRTAELLAQHQTFLEQAQEVAHIGSWVAELDGSDRLDWSAEAHRIFGVPAGQFAGSSEAFFAFVHPDDRIAVRAASEAAAAGGPAYDVEHRVVRPDGSVRWVHEKASRVGGAQGRPLRMVGTVQDITDRRLLEDQLRQSQKMEAIGRLAGGIAHDLNNALTAIAGYAELARGELPSDSVARADVDEIRRAAERAGSVTRQLLAFSRKQLLEPRVFDVNDTVAAIARLLSRLLGPDVRVLARLADDRLDVVGDPGQIEQALINLAVNARDAMPAGGTLTLSTERIRLGEEQARGLVPMPPGDYIVLRVADTGHGMKGETMSRIFEPFFTTKDPGKGTGLGLSMVYGTLKQIGGFIFVDSEVDRGTTFQLFFPPAKVAAEPQRPPAAPRAEPHGQETLLIVEDETAVRNLVASALRNEGYELLLAASAEDALAIVDRRDRPIDLLLTDAIMPGRSGVELAAALTARTPALPVIIMSGYTDEALSLEDTGAVVECLQKPFTPAELRRRIRDALDR
jgi:PAS domain S-box-containing protein